MSASAPTDMDHYLFHEGKHFHCYGLFGAHIRKRHGKETTEFCIWAPNAVEVRLMGTFNGWNGEGYRLERTGPDGIWFLSVNGNLEGELYKYEITTRDGERFLKTDPYAFYTEKRPRTAGIIYSLNDYKWHDESWLLEKEKKRLYDEPMFIYEVHLGTWRKKENGDFYSYKELAETLIPYVKEQGFTHIEIMPITEHPFDLSWGYQTTGYYAVTSRYGTPHDFMHFVDCCHQHGLGVILDWVPGHFCKDAHGLSKFDGSFLYEYEHEWDRENYVWGTANFDLAKKEVHSFLISNALFWLDIYHIDGFRIDAVANLLYWPNRHENQLNSFGVEFLKKLNESVFQYDENTLMIAEDSTDFPLVTSPVYCGGLGFNYKWNMGWMNDVLTYMELGFEERSHYHSLISFSLIYAFSENFILPFSHDEVVHGKKSLLDKMPGDYWQKFAQLRLLIGYMAAHPGKKLLFMGTELAPFSEWKDREQLDWHLSQYELHAKFQHFSKTLLSLYKKETPLFQLDHSSEGFEWIDVHNYSQSIFSFIRKDKDGNLLIVICNFREFVYEKYKVGVPFLGTYKEILNSDSEEFGGSGRVNHRPLSAKKGMYHGKPAYIELIIPPFAVLYLKPETLERKESIDGKRKMCCSSASGRSGDQAVRVDQTTGKTGRSVRRKVSDH